MDAFTSEIKLFWNNFEITAVFYFTRNHVWNWSKIISAAEIISVTSNMLEIIHELQWASEIILKEFQASFNRSNYIYFSRTSTKAEIIFK